MEETPYCPQCNDRGWRGAAMCDCLKDLCRQEQIAELPPCWTWGISPSTPSA
ncbi:MAG: hypothetical protein ACLR1T_11630 [Evtepia gabavorous]